MSRKGDLEPRPNHWDNFRNRAINLVFAPDFLLALFLVFVFVCVWLLFAEVLMPFVVALVVAWLLNPLAVFVQKKFRLSRGGAVISLYLTVFIGSILFLAPLALQMGTNLISMAAEVQKVEVKSVIQKVSLKVQEFKQTALPQGLIDTFNRYAPENYQDKIEEVVSRVNQFFGAMLKKIGTGLMTLGNILAKRTMDLILIPILVFYFLLDFALLYPAFIRYVPKSYRTWVDRFCTASDQTLKNFVKGQLIVASVFGILMTLGLSIIGIKFSLVIGPLAGLANLVPYFGVVVSLVPALALAVYQGSMDGTVLVMVVQVLVLFFVIQTIDGLVLQPKIIGENVELHPLFIMIAILFGAQVGGIYGMIFAVPAAAVLKVLVQEFYAVFYERRSHLLQG